jgi:ribosomal protein L11 methylase PrmA
LAPVLRELAGVIQCVTQTNGVVILSGMRDDQVEDVLACFDSCVELGKVSIDGWTAVALQKVN